MPTAQPIQDWDTIEDFSEVRQYEVRSMDDSTRSNVDLDIMPDGTIPPWTYDKYHEFKSRCTLTINYA